MAFPTNSESFGLIEFLGLSRFSNTEAGRHRVDFIDLVVVGFSQQYSQELQGMGLEWHGLCVEWSMEQFWLQLRAVGRQGEREREG